MFISL